MENNHSVSKEASLIENNNYILQISPIADTISGVKARKDPEGTITYYEELASQLWLPPKVRGITDTFLNSIDQCRTAWGSLIGPYGFGKTAAATTLWSYIQAEGFLAIPPLSCTNFDELAYGIAALAEVRAPKIKKQIQKLFEDIWSEGLSQIIRTDSKRYEMSPQKVRQILQDKISTGQFTLDSRSHRLVEFLSKLGQIVTGVVSKEGIPYKGLVIILDELQQLLGPLDARAIVRFREFVWGMRTERSHCGIILALDTLLEARLARWAADVLHRIRENGPYLQLSDVYTREFPFWLWDKITNNSHSEKMRINPEMLTSDVLLSLGQLVERPDLANGPRTVIDVFLKAAAQYEKTGISYDVPNLVEDIHKGRFRYFGEGATMQRVITQILSDDWVKQDELRETMIRTVAAFPLGCPQNTIQRFIPDKKQFDMVKSELYGPLLVELSDGLALEQLQKVRRINTNWEQILSRCWETLPAMDALAAHAPDMVLRIIVPRLFPRGNPANPMWEQVSDEQSAVLTGWHVFRGTFDDAYPQREVALCITNKEPESWQQDVDICIALVCDDNIDSESHASVFNKGQVSGILVKLPLLKPLEEQLPSELERYSKYVQPEPFRPITILAALHELEAFFGNLVDRTLDTEMDQIERQPDIRRAGAFFDIAVDFIIRELVIGSVDVGIGHPIQLRGPELIHALFAKSCRHRFPQYQTLVKTTKWREVLSTYRKGIRSDCLSLSQRQGRENITRPKADLLKTLFGQNSSAAGDSFIRILGPLVETTGSIKTFSLCMSMHPAEVILLDYLKGLNKQTMPLDAGVELLRHQGYIRDETEEILELLIDRGFIAKDNNNVIRIIKSENIERELLMEKISKTHKELCLLGIDESLDSLSQISSIADLQNLFDNIEECKNERIRGYIEELENNKASLHEMIGTIVASVVPTNWPASDISIHLTGIATKLQQIRENILGSLRKELERTEKELGLSSPSDLEWTVNWRNKRDSYVSIWRKLQERVNQFKDQIDALALWIPQNNQLRSTQSLCAKVYNTDPGHTQSLNQLVYDFRERFATDSWGPLFTSGEFSKRLRTIQYEVQRLLYRYAQVFNQELETLSRQFGSILPSMPPPVFDVSVDGDEQYNLISESFQRLYRWAFDGFQSIISDCQRGRQNGEQWHHPDNSKISWNELNNQIETSLTNMSDIPDFEMVRNIGVLVKYMLMGFVNQDDEECVILKQKLFDDPSTPPNFDKLKKLFLEGRIMIRIESKNLGL